jgi:peptidoglycan hydrolase CwlO-like protein
VDHDRLDRLEEKLDRVHGWWQEGRSRIAQLESHNRQLEACVAEAGEHNACLLEEIARLQHALAAARAAMARLEQGKLVIDSCEARHLEKSPGKEPALARP